MLWILLSDRVVSWATLEAEAESWFQTVKGLGFVLASAGVLYVLTRRYLLRAERTAEQLRDAYDQTLVGWAAALDIRDHSTGPAHPAGDRPHRGARRAVRHRWRRARRHPAGGHPARHRQDGRPRRRAGQDGTPDDEEWGLIRQHPDMAVRMLSGIAFLEPALAIPWCHHEKWDGSGYPRGLAGARSPSRRACSPSWTCTTR